MRRSHFLLGWLIFFLALAGPAAAQSDEIEWSATVEVAFGQSMEFALTAVSPTPIEQATLFIRVPELPNTLSAVIETAPVPEFEAVYGLDLTQVQLSPFTTVTYWWLLQTSAGEVTLAEQSFTYEDDQFEWRMVADEGTVVHWTGDVAGLGQLGLDIVAESWPRLTRIIPAGEAADLNIYIYPSSADLRSALRLTGRDWVGAHAHPELGVILVTAVNNRTAAADLRQSIPHELSHWLIYQTAGPNYEQMPTWFEEGLATFVEGSPSPSYETVLATAVANQTTIPFTDLCQSFPDVEERTLLAYAQSASFIDYLQGRYGSQALYDLTVAYADGLDCEAGTTHVLQESLTDLNQAWLRRQQPRSPFAQFWLNNGFWLLLLTGGFALVSLLIIKPQRQD
jgi:hypothetical protein